MIQQFHSYAFNHEKTQILKKAWTGIFIAALFIISRKWKHEYEMFMNRWLDTQIFILHGLLRESKTDKQRPRTTHTPNNMDESQNHLKISEILFQAVVT